MTRTAFFSEAALGRRSRLALVALLAGFTTMAAGCATQDISAAEGAEIAVARGRQIALLQCSQCHQIEAAGESPNPMAPAFRGIRMRYNMLAFERRMAELRPEDHYEMPGIKLEPADVADVAAYIDTLRGR